MKYEIVDSIERGYALQELRSNDRERISRALISLALNEPDRRWVENILPEFFEHEDAWVRGVAATCAGHLARIHRALDTATILPFLKALLADPSTRGKAQDALDDIEMFARQSG